MTNRKPSQCNVLRKMPQNVMEKIEKLQLERKVQRLLYQLKMPQNVMKSGHSFKSLKNLLSDASIKGQ